MKVQLSSRWTLRAADGSELPARLIGLLSEIEVHGSLSAACQRSGASYRHAWSLLRDAEARLERPLVQMSRGRGTTLTPLAQSLVWADRRVEARLSPLLQTLASELQAELHKVMSVGQAPLRVEASHGFAIERLCELSAHEGVPVEWRYGNSSQGMAALHAGSCDVAGLHLPVGELAPAVASHHARWLAPSLRLVHVVLRRQGLIVARGNPKKIYGLADLKRRGVRFINRQPGSGTRLLLDLMLARDGLDPAAIAGYQQGEYTHAAVAAYVASGMADAAFGIELPARQFKLEFIPLQTERYFLVFDDAMLRSPQMQRLLAVLRGAAFRDAVEALAGYRADRCGAVAELDDVIAELQAVRG